MIFTAMTKLTLLTHLILNNITITEEVREEILTVITNNMELQHIEISGHLKRSLSRSISIKNKVMYVVTHVNN